MMKNIRVALIVLAVPAITLLGLHELAGTPIFKGYDVGFTWQSYPGKVVFSADPEGNMNCWIRLKFSGPSTAYLSQTSTNQHLRVYGERQDNDGHWITIVKEGQNPQERFEWPVGATVTVSAVDPARQSLSPRDWYVFPSNKSFDSQKRARWRAIGFRLSLVLLGLSLIGGVLEGVDKVRTKREPFSPQACLEALIGAVEGDTPEASKRMRAVLEGVLIEGVTVKDALARLKLDPITSKKVWFSTRREFRSRLEHLITELTRYLNRL